MWEPNPYDQDPFETGEAGPPEPLWALSAPAEPEPNGPSVPAVATPVLPPATHSLNESLTRPLPAVEPVPPAPPARIKVEVQPPRTVLRRLSELSVAPIRVDRPQTPVATLPPDVGRMEQILAGLEQQIATPRKPATPSPSMPNLMERIRAARTRAEQTHASAVQPVETVPAEAVPAEAIALNETPFEQAPVEEAVVEQVVVEQASVEQTQSVETNAELDHAELPPALAGEAEAESTVDVLAPAETADVPAAEFSVEDVPVADVPVEDVPVADGEVPLSLEPVQEMENELDLEPAVLPTSELDAMRAALMAELPEPPEFLPAASGDLSLEPPEPSFADPFSDPLTDPWSELGEEPAMPAFLSAAPAAEALPVQSVDVPIPEDMIPPIPAVLSEPANESRALPLIPPSSPTPEPLFTAADSRAARRHLESLVGALDVEMNEGLAALSQTVSPSPLSKGLSSTARERVEANAERFVVFFMSGARYALPIAEVLEMANVPRTTPLPNAPDFIRGVANLRGEVLAVVDLRTLLALDTTADLLRERMIVVRSPQTDAVAGLIVDSVRGLARLGASQIVQPSSPVEDRVADFLQGVASHEDQVLNVLDTRKLFAAPEMLSLTAV